MADITNSEVIKFCNEVIRPTSDRTVGNFYSDERLVDELAAKPQLEAELFKSLEGEIKDGSDTDGRPRLTGEVVKTIIAAARENVERMRANDSELLKRYLAAAVNPRN